MGHRLQERDPELVRRGQLRGLPGLLLEALGLDRGGQLAGQGGEHPFVGRLHRSPGQGEDQVRPDVATDVGPLGPVRGGAPDGCLDHPVAVGAFRPFRPEEGGVAHAERGPQVGQEVREGFGFGEGPGQRGHGLGLGMAAGGLETGSAEPVDEHGDQSRGEQVDDEGDDHLGAGDAQVVQRNREVVVGQQEPTDDRGQGGEGAAHQGHGHAQAEVEQEHGGEVDVVADVGQGHGHEREAHGRQPPAPGLSGR